MRKWVCLPLQNTVTAPFADFDLNRYLSVVSMQME